MQNAGRTQRNRRSDQAKKKKQKKKLIGGKACSMWHSEFGGRYEVSIQPQVVRYCIKLLGRVRTVLDVPRHADCCCTCTDQRSAEEIPCPVCEDAYEDQSAVQQRPFAGPACNGSDVLYESWCPSIASAVQVLVLHGVLKWYSSRDPVCRCWLGRRGVVARHAPACPGDLLQ